MNISLSDTMGKAKLTKEDKELIALAAGMFKKKRKFSSVASAVKAKDSKVYLGLNIEHNGSSPCSMCAEYPAIGAAYVAGNVEVDTVVAVLYYNKKYSVIPPCGRCREFMTQFGNPWVIVSRHYKVRLMDLLPEHEVNWAKEIWK
jgi:cytidine deaminase